MNLPRTLCAAVLACAACAAAASEKGVGVDLNKLEAIDQGCRMHMVVSNDTDSAFDKYVLDLVIFDGDGVIARRAALDVSPVRAGKTSVYSFDVKGVSCKGVGQVLLNDVTGCGAADCAAGVSVTSRAGVPLLK